MKQLFSREELKKALRNATFMAVVYPEKFVTGIIYDGVLFNDWFNENYPEDNTISDEQVALNADMDLYPNNEAGAFDHLDQEDECILGIEDNYHSYGDDEY